jgi:hypothetical protein
MGVPQSRSGRFGEEKKLLALTGFEPRIIQLVSLQMVGNLLTISIITTYQEGLCAMFYYYYYYYYY